MPDQLVIPEFAKSIMNQMIEVGFEIYLVGGIVRDFLLDKETNDFDFATNARPEEIKQVFDGYYIMDYGEDHGTIAIHYQGLNVEITTYRIEEGYSDGRRPDEVSFVDNLKLDLSRRDFTINALAADIFGNIIDYHGGLDDFHRGIIRCVGNPIDRFEEDSLRVLRAIRFSLRLNFTIEDKTYSAIQESAKLLNEHSISGERIQSELSEIMQHTDEGIELLVTTSIFETLFTSILPKERQFLIDKSKVSSNSALNSWGLVLYILHTKSLDISHIFTKYPGYGKFLETQFITLAQWIEPVISLANCYDIGRLIRFTRDSSKHLVKYPEFKLDEFCNSLFELVCIVSSGQVKIPPSDIDTAIRRVNRSLPIDGNFIKSEGFRGKEIGFVLDYINTLYLYMNEKDTTFEPTINEIKTGMQVNLTELIGNIIIDKFCHTTDTIDELVNLLLYRYSVQDKLELIINNNTEEQILVSFLSKVTLDKPIRLFSSMNHTISSKSILEHDLIIVAN